MQTADVLDAMGGLVAQLKIYAAKLPPVVHLSAVPSGVKPRLEAIEEYEDIVSRFRGQSAGSSYKVAGSLRGWPIARLRASTSLSARSS